MATRRSSPTQALTSSLVPSRLPVAPSVLAEIGLDAGTWAVLADSIFPNAKTPEGVILAVRYCQARGLDVMKRPVHVVSMWSTALGRYVETVWPGIAEVQITAARTGLWAGLDSPRFGPELTKTFTGTVKRDDKWTEVAVTVTFPEWAETTVYRMVNGVRCPFSEMVFWEETYARQGRAEVPNEMWQKRPKGQLLKCAKAASLRAAFPEEAGYTAEEMEGKAIEGHAPVDAAVIEGDVVTAQPTTKEPSDTAAPSPVDETAVSETAPTDPAQRDAVIDAQVAKQVATLVERACKVGAWGQAEDYARARFNGAHLAYALAELEQAAALSVLANAKAAQAKTAEAPVAEAA
ncbi:phage recombination protein Bet [Thiohalocapsa marina]|uniref:phage recombination protein Bet n=1 Tax=Thiohalocapsa marina TaxID=424902 RepID=UPI0036DC8F0E